MELKDTIEMMNSVDFKERFKAEYYQLKIRFEKLETMVDKYSKGELSFSPKCPIELFRNQLSYMKSYLDVLVIRAKIEGVEL